MQFPMRLPTLLASVVSFAVVSASCGPEPSSGGEAASNIQTDVQAQRDLAEAFDAAVNSGDLQRFLDLYTEDAVRLPPGSDPIRGKKAISRSIQQFFDEYKAQHELEVLDVRVSGDIAFSRGRWRSTDTPKSGGDPTSASGSWTTIRERQSDRSWKTILEIWNRALN